MPGKLYGRREPTFGTKRNRRFQTRGPVLDALSPVFGFDLLDWQCDFADGACEVTKAGQWRHNLVACVVARQNGKTSLLARRILAGLYVFGDGSILHTAQDRAMPRSVFEELAEAVDNTPDLAREVRRIRWANGQEEVTLRDGSTYRILAPRQEAFRGWAKVGLVVFDEGREHRDDAVWSAAAYTQRAHPNPQTWIVSNAGDPDSVVLNRVRDRGRAAVENPKADPTMFYREWSAPDDLPRDDPETWAWANPSLGYVIRPETLEEELRTDAPERFDTEALCRWVDVITRHAIPWADWEACAVRDLAPIAPGTEVFAAVDMDPERNDAAVVLAAWVDGRLVVAVQQAFHDAAGVDEGDVADAVGALWTDWAPRTIGFDPVTCQGIVDRLGGKDVLPWQRVTGADWAVACGQLLDVVRQRALVHPDQHGLNEQVAAAGRRDYGDGTWRMSRLESGRPIPAAMAMARVVHVAIATEPAANIRVL